MLDALNNGCVLGGGCLGGDYDVGSDVYLGGVCGGVGDVCVVIGGVMGSCGDLMSMSRIVCCFCLCGSGGGGCVVFCGV